MWKDTMIKEMSSLHKNGTWDLSDLPKRKKAIGCKWVFTKKHRSRDGDVVCYEARLVGKCYAQIEDIDYNKVFSLVVKH